MYGWIKQSGFSLLLKANNIEIVISKQWGIKMLEILWLGTICLSTSIHFHAFPASVPVTSGSNSSFSLNGSFCSPSPSVTNLWESMCIATKKIVVKNGNIEVRWNMRGFINNYHRTILEARFYLLGWFYIYICVCVSNLCRSHVWINYKHFPTRKAHQSSAIWYSYPNPTQLYSEITTSGCHNLSR